MKIINTKLLKTVVTVIVVYLLYRIYSKVSLLSDKVYYHDTSYYNNYMVNKYTNNLLVTSSY